MFQKYAPIIILILFAIGTYFMIQGMDNAVNMSIGSGK
jgi:UDP-N-acetylmuramyl pentapeptide phosphotransferase/UDP-N-acetylglucosamine-1-phosphate transferase